MDNKTIEEMLLDEINGQYGTCYHFSTVTGISRSTLSTVFKRGIKNTSIRTINKICKNLSITVEGLTKGYIEHTDNRLHEDVIKLELCSKFENLSFKGQQQVLQYIDDITPKYAKK